MAKITDGISPDFFTKVTVNDAAFPDTETVLINVKWLKGFSISNEGTAVVEYSFNGTHVHGDLTPGKASESIFFDGRQRYKIWLRTATPGQVVRIEAWS